MFSKAAGFAGFSLAPLFTGRFFWASFAASAPASCANAGATVAGLASGVDLEAGTYDTVRVTLGSTLLLKGYVNFGTTTIYTNNDADGFGDNSGGGADRTDNGSTAYAVSTFTIPLTSRTQTFTGLSLPVSIDHLALAVPQHGV